MRDTILLTGATGALGSMILPRLLSKGYGVICLVRAADRASAQERIQSMIGTHLQVKVIRGDITEPRCGISDIDREYMAGRVKRILHCAASINFMDGNATQRANIAGVMHMLELADILDVWHIMHVSTAYVVGDASYLPEDKIYLTQRHRNPYEETKFIGETLIHAWALQRDDRRFSIFRPSVLVGCMDGSTPSFDTYYGYFKPLHRMAESMRRHANIGKELPPGVNVSTGGTVELPMTILMADKTVNYIPIDWCADMITELTSASPRNRTYNLVHDNPLGMRDGLSWSLDRLGISGIHVVNTKEEKLRAVKNEPALIQRLRRTVDLVHDAYMPYCTTSPSFQMDAAAEDLRERFKSPPIIDRAYVNRMLDYALRENWGETNPITTSVLA